MLDCHCHILYGVDDGARSLKESLRMLHAAKSVGIDGIIATPHVRNLNFNRELARERATEFRLHAERNGVAFRLGCELLFDVACALEEEELEEFCTEGTNHLLIEFHMSPDEPPADMWQKLYAFQRAGYTLMIAHPERYRFVQKNPSIANQWREMGALLQMDAIELMGGLFSAPRRCAEKLLKREVYDCYASDAHRPEDYTDFARAMARMKR